MASIHSRERGWHNTNNLRYNLGIQSSRRCIIHLSNECRSRQRFAIDSPHNPFRKIKTMRRTHIATEEPENVYFVLCIYSIVREMCVEITNFNLPCNVCADI